jgi:uncharacterized alpha-E superfamily protein
VYLLRGTLVFPADPAAPVLDAVLDISDSRITYRRRYLVALRVEPVLDLLMLDGSNPRSLIAQLRAFADDVEQLPRLPESGGNVQDRLAKAIVDEVERVDVNELAEVCEGTRPALESLFERLSIALPDLSDVLSQQYLTHLQTSRHLAPPEEGPLLDDHEQLGSRDTHGASDV